MTTQFNKDFLKSLEGKSVSEAEDIVNSINMKPRVIPTGTIMLSIARPGIVFLFHNEDNIVVRAFAGDPVQLEDFWSK